MRILSSLLLGISTGKVLATFALKRLPFQLIDTSIPGVSNKLAEFKTYDLLEFSLSLAVSFFLFFLNFIALKNSKKSKSRTLIDYSYLAFSIIIFLQVHFVTNSGTLSLATIFIIQTLYLYSRRYFKINKYKFEPFALINGFLVGFVILLILNSLTTSIAIPLILLFAVPVFYLLNSNNKFTTNPTHLLLVASLINPLNLKYLSVLLIITFLISFKVKLSNSSEKLARKYIYPVGIITLLIYNPLYYTGNFDTIEEGIWLGWLQSLISGKLIYRDFTAYHTPLLAWGMYGFTSIFGYTIRNFRLYLHILEIVGFIAIYFSIEKLLKKSFATIASMLVIFGITETFVRNNVEIRIGLGLISIAIFANYFNRRNSKYLYLSGTAAAISFLVSIEIGLASIALLSAMVFLFSNNRLLNTFKVASGFLLGVSPFFLYLIITGSFPDFVDQVLFYSKAFSGGYFNIPLERAIQTSFLRWHLVWQYLSSTAFYFEFSRVVILGSIMLITHLVLENSKSVTKINFKFLNAKDKYAFTLSLFGIILMRSVLGRSDYFHILFVLIIALPLSFYIIQRFLPGNKKIIIVMSLFVLFVFAGRKVNENFLSQRIFTLTTYSEVVDEYLKYDSDRSKILVGMEVNTFEMNKLLQYIEENVDKDKTIFVYPWNPELYFLANRANATSFDIPYAFWSEKYQKKLTRELEENNPELIVLKPGVQFGQMDANSLPIVNNYIKTNYSEVEQIFSYRLLKANNSL